MDLHTVEIVGIALALIAFITIRQSMWQSVKLGKLLRMPFLFAVLGIISLAGSIGSLGSQLHVGPLDIALIGTELALGVLAGWLMGRSTEIRTLGDTVQSRLVGLGIVVWLGYLAVRLGLAFAAHAFHAGLAEQSGSVILVVAVIKGVQALIIRERVGAHHAAQAAERRNSYATLGLF